MFDQLERERARPLERSLNSFLIRSISPRGGSSSTKYNIYIYIANELCGRNIGQSGRMINNPHHGAKRRNTRVSFSWQNGENPISLVVIRCTYRTLNSKERKKKTNYTCV